MSLHDNLFGCNALWKVNSKFLEITLKNLSKPRLPPFCRVLYCCDVLSCVWRTATPNGNHEAFHTVENTSNTLCAQLLIHPTGIHILNLVSYSRLRIAFHRPGTLPSRMNAGVIFNASARHCRVQRPYILGSHTRMSCWRWVAAQRKEEVTYQSVSIFGDPNIVCRFDPPSHQGEAPFARLTQQHFRASATHSIPCSVHRK